MSDKRVPRWTCSNRGRGGDHPLFALPNVILLPHSAGSAKKVAIRMAIPTARNVLAGIDGKLDPSMVINREVLRDAVSSRSRCQPQTRALFEVAHQNFPLPVSKRWSASLADEGGS